MIIYLAGSYSRSYVHDEMLIYLAGQNFYRIPTPWESPPKIAILESFVYYSDWMDEYVKTNWDFILDSGAFTYMSSREGSGAIDWEEYIERYADLILRLDQQLFFELDIDVVVGLDRVRQLTKQLEDRVGRKSIPVWHKSRGKNDWIETCEEYDYVAIGGIVSKEIVGSDRRYFNSLCKIAHDNGAKIHALGFTPSNGDLEKFDFDSVDSAAWIYGNRGGFLYKFNGKSLDKISPPKGKKLAAKPAAIHNFKEWVKFQNYMRTK